MYRRILIATDGSELAGRGLEEGLQLAARLQARVDIVTVSEPWTVGVDDAAAMGMPYDISPEYHAQREQAAQAILGRARERAQALGVPAEIWHVPDRHVADAVIDTAAEQGADLIVMASHGRRGVGRLLLGSQAAEPRCSRARRCRCWSCADDREPRAVRLHRR